MKWSEEDLSSYYSSNEVDLSWLKKSSQHQFRWKTIKGPWVTSDRRISSSKKLFELFSNSMPTDVYVSTSSWLNPVNLPRIKEIKKPSPILLDHLVVFDIDIRPFCLLRLEEARKATLHLKNWIIENTEIKIRHITFSGSKGFHIIAEDPDREPFSEPDPRLREDKVRSQRKRLLDRVIEAGHPVDNVVTADTRRIIRLPGTIHGKTGWVCTIINEEWINTPVKEWINKIPRHETALKIPKWPPIRIPKLSIPQIKFKMTDNKFESAPQHTSLELSSHVSGTKDRSAFVSWLPRKWGDIRTSVEKSQELFSHLKLGPVAYFHDNERVLAIIPRAIPKDFLLSKISQKDFKSFVYETRHMEHSWTRISGRLVGEDWESEIEPISVLGYDYSENCLHPWSAPHLEICSRLGLPIRELQGEISGSDKVPLRVAIRR